MRKIKSVIRGIFKGVRDAAPVPSKAAENETKDKQKFAPGMDAFFELIAERVTSRGIMVVVLVYIVDMLFNFGLFS